MALFTTDLEGPITLNDNAFELSAHFLERGDAFFKLISRYDDVLADIVRREGYKAGDTLRLILPFFLAFGVGRPEMEAFSTTTLRSVPEAKEAIFEINEEMPVFIVSTSYEPYVRAACRYLGLAFERAYCTKLDLERYELRDDERRRLEGLYLEIIELPMIEVPEDASSVQDLSPRDRATIERLDEIFWVEIAGMEIGRILKDVAVVGGREKAWALKDILEREGRDLSELIYVGDSITDCEALKLVREGGGLAVSFNGNRYALRAAEFAVISGSARPLAHLARAFQRGGRREAVRLIREGLPGAKLTDRIDEYVVGESEKVRKALRGEKVGELG